MRRDIGLRQQPHGCTQSLRVRFFVGWVHPRKNHALDLAHFQSTARGSELLGPTSRRARATDASRLGGPVLKTVMTRAGEPLLGAAAGGTTTYVGDLIKGEETTWGDLAWGSGVGAVMPMIPGGANKHRFASTNGPVQSDQSCYVVQYYARRATLAVDHDRCRRRCSSRRRQDRCRKRHGRF